MGTANQHDTGRGSILFKNKPRLTVFLLENDPEAATFAAGDVPRSPSRREPAAPSGARGRDDRIKSG